MKSFIIKSAQGDYPVHFYSKITESSDLLKQTPPTGFVVDRNVYNLYKATLDALMGNTPVLLLDATEEEKTLSGIMKCTSWMQKSNFTKNSRLCAIGGGIIQDIATFSSHIYYRGIQWTFYPTTLLSMSDSSIGAKCGINLNEFKNQLGVFQSPSQVIICSEFINTLHDKDVASGYGEILKLYLTAGNWAKMDELEGAVAQGGLRNPQLLNLIYESLLIKKGVIEADEYEADYRRVLNYGHSFGHSLEAITNHEIPHGLAVAWGLDLINYLGSCRGYLDRSQYERVHNFIKKYLPFHLSKNVSSTDLIQGAKRDKKVASGQINLVFLNKTGSLQITKTPFDEALSNQIHSYLTEQNVYYHN